MWQIFLKCLCKSNRLHGVTFLLTVIIIVTAVRTLNLTKLSNDDRVRKSGRLLCQF